MTNELGFERDLSEKVGHCPVDRFIALPAESW
jgi:hypothetical protein